MISAILTMLTGFGAPVMQLVLKLLPILYQYRLLKTEQEVREWERRFKEAIKQTEKSALDPAKAHDQYNRAKNNAKSEWDKRFGGGDSEK